MEIGYANIEVMGTLHPGTWREFEQAYEQSPVYRQEILPALQPFFVGEYATYCCEVKYSQ
jgi:hypothetical protein